MRTKMTEKQKFDKAVELLKQSSELYDKASKLLAGLEIETYPTNRPIQLYLSNPRKISFFIYSGISKIAEINETELQVGMPFYAEGDEEYRHTIVDGIVFHERGYNEKTV